MQEFSSVTASSYDAESLAPLLNEKAADGWSVVAIVTAGTNIVAYLQRETDGVAETPVVDASAAAPVVEETVVEETVVEETVVEEPVVEEMPAEVEEPSGWAAVPDEQPAVAEETIVEETVVEETVVEEPAVEEPVVEPTPEPEPVVETAPASTVPAGWYADPSGRFELRYWDGNAWTEHVSRAGQQFTDPPVA